MITNHLFSFKNSQPSEAIIAVTLNCNARCTMCNIWQNKIKNEIKPEFYKKLPPSLKEINITGGEPFLRSDIDEIIKTIKETCPKARLLINSNGYLTSQIKKIVPKILQYDPNIAIRISLDGFSQLHTTLRGLPNFFEHAMESLMYLKKLGIKDLGISYTLMEKNKTELIRLFNFCEKNNFEFSMTVVSDSLIYFGIGKMDLRPKFDEYLSGIFNYVQKKQYKSTSPKKWFRAWFEKQLYKYIDKSVRYFDCTAGKEFFYIDSIGRVYTCHLKPWLMGSLLDKSFNDIYFSKQAEVFRHKAQSCNDCWMVCTTREAIKNNFFRVLKEILKAKLKFMFQK